MTSAVALPASQTSPVILVVGRGFGITSPTWFRNDCAHKSLRVNTYSAWGPPATPGRTRVLRSVHRERAGLGLVTAHPSARRADAPLGEVLTSPTHLPFVGEVPPCLRQVFAGDEVTKPAVGPLALDGAFKLLAQV